MMSAVTRAGVTTHGLQHALAADRNVNESNLLDRVVFKVQEIT